jgi:hypothetical protein
MACRATMFATGWESKGMALWIAGACLLLAALAGLAERRRSRQEGAARIGWVPWSGVVVALLFAGLGALVVGLQG